MKKYKVSFEAIYYHGTKRVVRIISADSVDEAMVKAQEESKILDYRGNYEIKDIEIFND